MGKENNTGKIMAVVFLVIGIMAGVVMCVFLKLKYGTPKLQPYSKAAETSEVYDSEEEEEYAEVRKNLDRFVVGKKQSTSSDNKENELETDDDYICEVSSSRLLTAQDLQNLINQNHLLSESMPADKSVAQMIINEMYARHGYEFKNSEIQAYFEQKEWYLDIGSYTNDMDSIYRKMSDIEKANIDFLKEYK